MLFLFPLLHLKIPQNHFTPTLLDSHSRLILNFPTETLLHNTSYKDTLFFYTPNFFSPVPGRRIKINRKLLRSILLENIPSAIKRKLRWSNYAIGVFY